MQNKKRNLLNQDIVERVKKENEEIIKPSKAHFQIHKAMQITIAVLLAIIVLFGLIYSLIQIL